MAIPFFGDRIQSAVLSGTGGGLSLTLTSLDSGELDIQSLITEALEFQSDEELSPFHPAIALVQMGAEVTDPINYGPYWHRLEPWWDSQPISVLLTEGLLDIYTPPQTTEALAAASGTPILSPTEQISSAQELTSLYDEPTPARSNRLAWDGSEVTSGLAQYPEEGHFAIFYISEAADLYGAFLSTGFLGVPEIF